MKDKQNWVAMMAVGLLLVLPVLTLAAEGKSPAKKPVVTVPAGEFTFGQVVEGTELEHDFKIGNKGDAPLTIVKVKPG